MDEKVEDNLGINTSNVDEELEELKKLFIVDGNNFQHEKIKDYLKIVVKHCKISSEGRIFLENKDISKIDTIALMILARFLGNKIDNNIQETITPSELSDFTHIPKNSVTGHVTTLSQRGFVLKPEDGVYLFNPSKIDEFLGKLT